MVTAVCTRQPLALNKKIVEIQIRTMQMHEEAEYGISAYWAYHQSKNTKDYLKKRAIIADKKELTWIKQLANWQKELSDPEEFLNSLKIDFFKDRILALTPKGEVIDLPLGATPIDFAYQIHSEIGDHCVAAKINGKIVPLSTELKSGDAIEIITQKNKAPSESWLNFVKTSNAKNRVKSALNRKRQNFENKINSPTKTELKLTISNRMGLIETISKIIAESHIAANNIGLQPPKNKTKKVSAIKISCPLIENSKLQKLISKLKEVKEIKKISWENI